MKIDFQVSPPALSTPRRVDTSLCFRPFAHSPVELGRSRRGAQARDVGPNECATTSSRVAESLAKDRRNPLMVILLAILSSVSLADAMLRQEL